MARINGKDWEADLFSFLPKNIVKRASLYADQNQGTDFLMNGLPCDLTLDFYGKDHMEILHQEVKIDSHNNISVLFGIRTGNSHRGYTRFAQPVLVMGVSIPSRQYEDCAAEAFVRKFSEIQETGEDLYWAWMDAHPEYDV